MQGKKRYLVVALFLLIGLTTFSFAAPKEELKEKKTISGTSEKVTNDKKVNNSYTDALEAVEEAEENPTIETVEAARAEVQRADDATVQQRQELEERIDVVEESIDVAALVTELETLVTVKETIPTAEDKYPAAETALDEMDEGDVKDNLETRLTRVANIINDKDKPEYSGIQNNQVTKDDVTLVVTDTTEVTKTVKLNNEDVEFKDTFKEEGTYVVTLMDEAFNTEMVTFTIDKTSPKFVDLKSGNHYETIKVEVDDDTSIITVLNNDTKTTTEVTNGTVLTEDATYYITATDEAGNETAIWVAIDTIAPTITGVTNGSIVNKSENIYVNDKFLTNVKITGPNSKGQIVTKEFTRSDFTVGTNNENFSFKYKANYEGEWTVVATDKAGNTRTETFTIDRTAPTAEVTTSNKGNSTNQDVTVTLKTNEPIVTPEGWTVVTEGTEFTKVYSENGKYTLTVKDLPGNETEVKFEVKRIDKVAPEAIVTKSNNDKSTNQDVVVTIVANEAIYKPEGWTEVKTNKEHEFTKVYSENGKYEVVITDKAGNKSTIKFEVKRIDMVAPEATVTKSNNDKLTNQDVVVTIVANEAIYKPEGWTEVKTNKEHEFTKVYSENGLYELTIKDKAGNQTTISFEVKNIDKVAPVLTLNGKKKITLEAGVDTYEELGIKVTDNVDATIESHKPKMINFTAPDGTKETWLSEVDTTRVGEYKISYSYEDKAGNAGIDANDSRHAYVIRIVNVVDTISPEFVIEEGYNENGINPYIKLKDNTELSFKVYRKGTEKPIHEFDSTTVGKSFKIGWHGGGLYTIVATDAGGNTTSKEFEVYHAIDSIDDLNNALKNGGKAILTKNITLDTAVEVAEGKKLEIDLNGYELKISNPENSSTRLINNKGDLSIKNGSLINEKIHAYGIVDNYGTLTIDNVEVRDNGSFDGSTIKNRNGKVKITNSKFNITSSVGYKTDEKEKNVKFGNAAVWSEGELVIKNTNINSDSERAYSLIVNNGKSIIENVNAKGKHGGLAVTGGTVTINDMKYESDVHYGIYVSNKSEANVTINGGEFIGQLQGLLVYNEHDKADVKVTVNGGTFSSKTGKEAAKVSKGNKELTHKMELIIKGGTFVNTELPEEYIADGYRQNAEGRVVKENAISTQAEMVSAIEAGGKFELDTDLTLTDEPLVIKKGKEVEIDLNGKTITGRSTNASASKLITVSEGATLKLTGEGTIDFTAGKPDTNWGGEGQLPFPGYSSNTISNIGKLIIDGPTLINNTARGGASYVIDNYQGSELIVKSGKIHQTGGDQALRIFANSNTLTTSLTVEGGEIIGRRALWIQLPNSDATRAPKVNVNITGGVLRSNDTGATGYNIAIYSYSYGESFKNVNVNISGGEFFGHVAFGGGSKNGQENVNVTGGVFHNDLGRYLANDGWEDIVKPAQ